MERLGLKPEDFGSYHVELENERLRKKQRNMDKEYER